MNQMPITVITPTTGKSSLLKLMDSLKQQEFGCIHLLIWDDKRDAYYRNDNGYFHHNWTTPYDLERESTENYIVNSIVIKDSLVQGDAIGSALRAVGLMIANTPFVTFADDDVWFEKDHFGSLLRAIKGNMWAFALRKIWAKNAKNEDKLEYLGIDEFESMGAESKTEYKMVDNSCMMFQRRLGSSAACLYRETMKYDDDRLMYKFLDKYGGDHGKTRMPTVNQICPKRVEDFFREYCTKDKENHETIKETSC